MTTEVATTPKLASRGMIGQINDLVASIDLADQYEARDAYDRIKVAREWAKLQEDAAELIERLVWLEAIILRRIGELDPKVLPACNRRCARHYATLSDADISKLLTDYPARTAVTAYNLWATAQGIRQANRRGYERLASGPGTYNGAHLDDPKEFATEQDDTLRHAISTRVTTVRAAAAVLVEEYLSTYTPIRVSQVVDEFMESELPLTQGASALEENAFRRGLSAAVREAISGAPVEGVNGHAFVPAFITTYDEDEDQWLRIPSEFATIADARQMISLRREQVAFAQQSLKNLEDNLELICVLKDRKPDEFLRGDPNAVFTRRRHEEQRETQYVS